MCSQSESCTAESNFVLLLLFHACWTPGQQPMCQLCTNSCANPCRGSIEPPSLVLISLCFPLLHPSSLVDSQCRVEACRAPSALLSHNTPAPGPQIQGGECQVRHQQGSDNGLCHSKGRKGRSTAGNEWIGFNPSRSLLSMCGALT